VYLGIGGKPDCRDPISTYEKADMSRMRGKRKVVGVSLWQVWRLQGTNPRTEDKSGASSHVA
jgi:hypothetical protein